MDDYYKINDVDILPYIAFRGLKIEENDIDAPDAGRTMDGTMQRSIVGNKDKHYLKFRPLTTAESNIVLNAVSSGQFVTVSTNLHPKYGTVIKTMYNSARSASVLIRRDNESLWDEISFNLIER